MSLLLLTTSLKRFPFLMTTLLLLTIQFWLMPKQFLLMTAMKFVPSSTVVLMLPSPTFVFIFTTTQAFNRKFKCSVRLTGAIGSNDVYPLGEGKLHVSATISCGYIAIRCFYSPHLSSTFTSPRDIFKTEYPFKKLIIQAISIRKIKADTLRIFWHQRLGYTCDQYLYSAHKFIDSVLEFKRRSDVLSRCLTCIKVK